MILPTLLYRRGRIACCIHRSCLTVLFAFALFMGLHVGEVPAQPPEVIEIVGPMVGVVTEKSAQVLYRPGAEEMPLRLTVYSRNPQIVKTVDARAEKENDFVAKFVIRGLQPSSEYQYQIESLATPGKVFVTKGKEHAFKTASLARPNQSAADKSVTVAFVSCVETEPNPLWDEISKLDIDTLCLMGDTPYIDRTDLATVREKHRKFLQIPVFASLISKTPTIGTWDDHDFGLNNANGLNTLEGKLNTRRAFQEYRAHSQYGNGSEGVYHRVDLGMIEGFMLDPRYFSQTKPSPVDASQPTCFGSDQWQWLLESLKASQAPFKVLAMGQIWQDKKNGETDDMFTYWYERDALLDFIKQEKISGVMLLGGDIHVARHLIHPRRVGYDLHDFIISPGHDHVITQLNVFHPSLEWSHMEGNQFLTLTAQGDADDASLVARFRQPGGVVNREVVIPLRSVTPSLSSEAKPEQAKPEQAKPELRAHWSFDDDMSNRSVLGKRLDATSHHGASIQKKVGLGGGALSLRRFNKHYLSVHRSFLDDNSAAHTVSLWFKPRTLPEHGSANRHFLLESTAENTPSAKSAWHLSLGLRAAEDSQNVNLQLYTFTLEPAGQPQAAPVAISQGPFDTIVDRSDFADRWSHVVFTFDSRKLRLFINGNLLKEHTLPIPGPAAESGGLILGGHREGVGRNFDGWLDEVKVWQGVLSDEEIGKLSETTPR